MIIHFVLGQKVVEIIIYQRASKTTIHLEIKSVPTLSALLTCSASYVGGALSSALSGNRGAAQLRGVSLVGSSEQGNNDNDVTPTIS